ncbi:MAG TPA: prolyl oligopeptidase family serine peptidase [Bacteriovoracaceae bacterium]|nr:prolyl oligopeptidase family serine peptidase [Bacteriovoracaceae bacterium]
MLKQLTHAKYLCVYGFSVDFKLLVYGDRYKTEGGKFYTRLYLRNMETGSDVLLADDAEWEYRLSWSAVMFDRNKENIFLRVDKENKRKLSNLIKINLETKEIKRLLPPDQENPRILPLGRYVDGSDLYFFSQISGFGNFYHFDLQTQQTTQLTFFKDNISDFKVDRDNSTLYFCLAIFEKVETQIVKLTLNGAKPSALISHALKGSHYLVSGEGSWFSSSSIDGPLKVTEYEIGDDLKLKKELPAYHGLLTELVHNTYSYLEYETFDGKMIPAFLSLPKDELRGAIITAFYGGEDYYSWKTQLFTELGFAVLSPAIRGSPSRGLEWQNLIKGDLGGDEILDLHWGARYLEQKLGLEPHRIGLDGESHGGYAVLRAMTMPVGFKGIAESTYPYGFGICWAGFADLEDFYRTSNIPDWIVNLVGPYEGNEEKYRNRSPVHFFENLKAPIFISHGTNDPRVCPSSMEGFLDKLRHSQKEYVFHLMEGQGHGSGNQQQEILLYERLINFLKNVLLK